MSTPEAATDEAPVQKRIPNSPPSEMRIKDFMGGSEIAKAISMIQPARAQSFMNHYNEREAQELVTAQMIIAELAAMALATVSKPKMKPPAVSSEEINWALDIMQFRAVAQAEDAAAIKGALGIQDVEANLSDANAQKYTERKKAMSVGQSAG